MDQPTTHRSRTEALLDWYLSLPLDHRQDIAALVSSCPGFELTPDELDREVVTERFSTRVRAYATGPWREAGSLLALRAFIQMFIIDKRSSREAWREVAAALETLAEKDPETFGSKAAEARFRGEQWLVSCDKWVTLIAGALSDAAIRDLTDPRRLVSTPEQ